MLLPRTDVLEGPALLRPCRGVAAVESVRTRDGRVQSTHLDIVMT